MTITIFVNSCFLLTLSGIKLLIDPCLPMERLIAVDYDYVIISHGHIDHCLNMGMIDKPIISNKEVAKRKTDIVIAAPLLLKDVEIIPLNTNHPHWLQNNILYDFLLNILFARSIVRCGKSLGFIIKNKKHTIYYFGDDILTIERLLEIKNKYSPNIALISFQKHRHPMLNLLSPLSRKNEFEGILQCPVLPLHLPNTWYRKNKILYEIPGVFLDL